MKNALLILLICAASLPAVAQTNPAAITAAELREHVRYLASDELAGRGSGTKGNDEAAIYIAAKLKVAGLKPAGINNTFFQPFDFVSAVKLGEKNTLEMEGPAGDLSLKVDADFRPFGFSGTAAVEGSLVFVGYGVTAPERNWDDFKGQDLKGKIALVLVNDPDFETGPDVKNGGDFGGKAMTYYGRWTYMIVISLMVCITAIDANDCESPLWTPLAAVMYVSLWGIPHFMTAVSEPWAFRGLLAKVIEYTTALFPVPHGKP